MVATTEASGSTKLLALSSKLGWIVSRNAVETQMQGGHSLHIKIAFPFFCSEQMSTEPFYDRTTLHVFRKRYSGVNTHSDHTFLLFDNVFNSFSGTDFAASFADGRFSLCEPLFSLLQLAVPRSRPLRYLCGEVWLSRREDCMQLLPQPAVPSRLHSASQWLRAALAQEVSQSKVRRAVRPAEGVFLFSGLF